MLVCSSVDVLKWKSSERCVTLVSYRAFTQVWHCCHFDIFFSGRQARMELERQQAEANAARVLEQRTVMAVESLMPIVPYLTLEQCVRAIEVRQRKSLECVLMFLLCVEFL
jgi:hypothetical protein